MAKSIVIDDKFHLEVKSFALKNDDQTIISVIKNSFYFYRKNINKSALQSLEKEPVNN